MREDERDTKVVGPPEPVEPVPPESGREEIVDEPTTEAVERGFTMDRQRLAIYALTVLVIIGALYFVLPKITETGNALEKIEEADPVWIAVALGFNLLSFVAYIALFAGIVGGQHRAAAGARAARLARLVPDHARGPCGDASVLRGRRRRNRAHLLGAATRRHAGA